MILINGQLICIMLLLKGDDWVDNYLYDFLQQEINARNELKYFRHDFVNHIHIIKMYLDMDCAEEATKYIYKLINFVEDNSYKPITGNLEIDMVLSHKIAKIEKLGAEVDICASIPQKIDLDVFDIVTVFGNLLDNAYEALICTNEKRLSLDINLVDDNLYIMISNSHNNSISFCDNLIVTSKDNAIDHGIGISSVKHCVDKNSGKIDIVFDSEEFTVEICLPIFKIAVNSY